ncbi:hypothetical protein [Plantibacter sp. YIM 135347]|uniref:hypothetical protein n=1 Tax=Plantibacter sp. YIM 135347 TaxID=3423919 RepID=UPI003D326CBA
MATSEETPGGMLPLITRRGLVVGGFAAATLLAVSPAGRTSSAAAAPLTTGAAATTLDDAFPLVPELASAPDRTAFAPTEQVLADYLVIVAAMANDIVTDGGATHGWMSGGWWRTPAEPFNARVQEHVATLAWFYANARPWNPYAGDVALLTRLDAAIGHYLSLQHDDGSWSEYSADEHSRAATGFGLVSLTETYQLLGAASVLPERRAEIADALRLGAAWFLDFNDATTWGTPTAIIRFANQTMAGLVGCAHAAEALGDSALTASVTAGIGVFTARAQAAGGWFYEPTGLDLAYSNEVQLPDMADLYRVTGDQRLVDMADRWLGILRLVTVREPDGAGFIGMGAASARTDGRPPIADAFTDAKGRTAFTGEFLQAVPGLAAYRPSLGTVETARADWAASTTPVVGRAKQNTSPRLWMHVTAAAPLASSTDRAAAIAALPTIASSRFTDGRTGVLGMQFVFVRRPRYYLASVFGQRASTKVRNGSQLLWHPAMGTVAVGFNDAAVGDDFWGTVLGSGADDARATMNATYRSGGSPVAIGALGAVTGDFTMTSAAAGITTVTSVADTGFTRSVTAPSAAVEQVPLLLRQGDVLQWSGAGAGGGTAPAGPVWGQTSGTTATGLSVTRNGVAIQLSWGAPAAVTLTDTGRTVFDDGDRRQHVLRVPHGGALTLGVAFSA